jgi:hypothetical protein
MSLKATLFGSFPGSRSVSVLLFSLVLFAGVAVAAQDQSAGSAKDHKSIGFIASDEAGAKEVGLPIYPGARPHKDKDDDTPSANLGLWGGAFGFKLAVVKMESDDSPDKLAAFYRKALGKYGKVLDCTNASGHEKDNDKSSRELGCDDDKPDKGGMLFKSGTKNDQHVVGITPNGGGSIFALVYVMAHGSSN